MAEPRHRPPGDNSFLVSLGRHLAAAVGLVVVMAGAFWAIGSLGDDDGELVVAASPPAATATAPDTPASGTTGDASPTAPADAGEGSPTSSPTATPTGDDASPDDATASPTGEGIPPGEISLQVLDAVLIDGNTAAQEIADELEADGYDVVVVNKASKVYDVTTVFFTPGFEDSARQIAAAYGFTRVEEKPSNLSSTVRVHLVIGRDRS